MYDHMREYSMCSRSTASDDALHLNRKVDHFDNNNQVPPWVKWNSIKCSWVACVLPKTIGELVRVRCRYSCSFILFEQSRVSKSAKFAERRTISSLYRGHTGLARNSPFSSVTLTFLWLISLSYLSCAIYTFDRTTFVYDNSIVLIKERLYFLVP